MKLPISWLKEYVDISGISNKEYSETLSIFGSKVENIEYLGEEIKNVVTGRITSIEPHPDADKLCVCMVDISGDTIQIVTGAKNIAIGDIIPTALDKSSLPGGVKIKSGKLRGVVSCGMMCSHQELGLTLAQVPFADEDGILIMPKDTPIGRDIKEFFGLDDSVIEFEITSNRPDCFSVFGLALETSVALNKPIKINTPKDYIDGELGGINASADKLCNRYMAKVITDIKIMPSPEFITRRLSACGINPINNIVDITNYVLLEYGQPMHAFDFIDTINVRKAKSAEKILALDNNEYTLTDDMLVVADKDKPIAIAGIMGGANSSVSGDTTKILLECANFDADTVRSTSSKLGIRTESSHRFERGLNPNITEIALNRACELIESLGFGKVSSGTIDIKNCVPQQKTLPLETDKINALLGTDISKADMIVMLEKLLFKVQQDIISVPYFRCDISGTHDISEEIARVYGYNNIPTTNNVGTKAGGRLTDSQLFAKNLSEKIRSFGFNESYTYTLISEKMYDKIYLEDKTSSRITNPLGEDFSILRKTAMPSILECLSRNFNHRNPVCSLFELANIYLPVITAGKVDVNKSPLEEQIITLATYGEFGFNEFKGLIEAILCDVLDVSYTKCDNNPLYHPGRCGNIYIAGENVGVFGELHPNVNKNYSISKTVLSLEINYNKLFNAKKIEKLYKPLPKFPAITRDIAIICDLGIEAATLENIIKTSSVKILEDIKLFDVYTGKQVEDGKKSIAYSLRFRADDRTLTDEECDNAINKILKQLQAATGATLR